MTLKEIYDNTNYLINKDYLGNSFSPEEFNAALKTVSNEIQKSLVTDFMASNNDNYISRYVTDVDLIYNNGKFKVPEDYYYAIRGIGAKPIVFLQHDKFIQQAGSVTSLAPGSYIATIIGGEGLSIPKEIKGKFWYVRKYQDAWFDYAEDEETNLVYMPERSYIRNGSLYDWSNNLIQADVIKTGYSYYKSKTRELDFDENIHQSFVYSLVQMASTNTQNQLGVQVSTTKLNEKA